MAKGFGSKQEEQLGYILVLMPEVNAYAAKFSLDFFKGRSKNKNEEPEKFIGITSMLEEAQVWKTQKLAKEAIEKYYLNFVLQQLEEETEVRVNIKRLKRFADGTLQTEMVEPLYFYNPK